MCRPIKLRRYNGSSRKGVVTFWHNVGIVLKNSIDIRAAKGESVADTIRVVSCFADIAATVTELLGVEYATTGKSFAKEIL